MKRIKIMLLSLVILATVGGVLAFKSKELNFCIYKKTGTPVTCPLIIVAETLKVTFNAGVPPIYYTLVNNGNCPASIATFNCTLRLTDVVIDF